MALPLCTEAIYSNEYFNYVIRNENTLVANDVLPRFECTTMVGGGYGVGYKLHEAGATYDLAKNYYESVPKCYGLMDVSVVEDTGAERLYELPGINVSGKDIIIGFIDTGIDYRNPIFSTPAGTRIEYIWDQGEEVYGTAADYMGFGAEYNKAMIDEAIASEDPYNIVPSIDEIGHGTFLASIAAGGRDEAEGFRGMAFLSSIVVVKLKQAKKNLRDFYFIADDAPCYSEDDILLGIRYLLDKAMEINKPIVICIGVGSSQGNHTGSSVLELYLERLVNTRGICTVSSVGNELGYGGHFAGHLAGQENAMERVEIGISGVSRGFFVELWGRAPGILKTALLSPTGERYSNIPFLDDRSVEIRFLYEGTKVYVTNISIDGATGDQLIFFRFEGATQGIWTIEVNSYEKQLATDFDAWLPIKQFLDTEISFVKSEPDVTICSPGNTRGVISVAGYDHINKSLYFRSGRGYTRDGAIKPDITAPSVSVKGAFATASGRSLYTTMSGTSVGAAVTAGAAALIMNWVRNQGIYPDISTEIVRQILIRGAKHVSDIPYPNNWWGYGVLDLLSTFEKLRN